MYEGILNSHNELIPDRNDQKKRTHYAVLGIIDEVKISTWACSFPSITSGVNYSLQVVAIVMKGSLIVMLR